ncbi:hypothetical protein SORBI_3005G054501 [Sorghum bicolor]|uniref:Uncharacterized protein n=1 Tax=Sorghum bicolor TaxID=4558 RepID=A0A1Z5RHY3_SORBI|nr:hypothetical protein SORBI_3005G054501 [Sorghum bicolor]
MDLAFSVDAVTVTYISDRGPAPLLQLRQVRHTLESSRRRSPPHPGWSTCHLYWIGDFWKHPPLQSRSINHEHICGDDVAGRWPMLPVL